MLSGTKAAGVAIPIAASGIVIGVAIQSGLATRSRDCSCRWSAGQLLSSLAVILAGCVILGMALPTVAAYSVGSILFAPSLVGLGVIPMCAHVRVLLLDPRSDHAAGVRRYLAAGLAQTPAGRLGWLLRDSVLPDSVCYGLPAEIMLMGGITRAIMLAILLVGVYAMAAGTTGF